MPALSACHAASGRHHRNPPYFLVDDCVGIAVAFVMRIMNLARRALMLASVMIALTNFIPKLRVTVPRHVEAPTELVQNISHEHFLFVGSNSSFLSSCPSAKESSKHSHLLGMTWSLVQLNGQSSAHGPTMTLLPSSYVRRFRSRWRHKKPFLKAKIHMIASRLVFFCTLLCPVVLALFCTSKLLL